VLHHGHIAIGRCLVDFGLVLFDVGELDLGVLLGFGVDSGAGEGGIEGRFAGGLVAIAHQLQVQLRRHGGSALVDHLMLDADGVAAALERVALDQFDAVHLVRFKAQGQLVLAVLELALAGKAHDALVRGQLPTDQTGLGHINTVFAFVKQHKILFGIHQVRVLHQLGMHQRTAFGVKAQLVQIGFDINPFALCCWCRRCRHLTRTGRRSHSGRHRSRRSRRLGGRCGLDLGKESGLVAVVDLPLVPQQDHGEAKNHPEDGAADVVHEDFLEEGDRNRVNRRGASSGMGSCPPAHQG